MVHPPRLRAALVGAWLVLLLATAGYGQEQAGSPPSVVEVAVNGDTAPAAEEGKEQSESCGCADKKDCSADVQAAVEPLQVAQKELEQKLDMTIEELDEIIEERNRLLEEIKRTRESLHSSRTEKESLREVLQATKTGKDELQQRLVNSQSQISTLKSALDTAHAEIGRLNEMSFVVQFRKEVVDLWDQTMAFAKNVVNRQG